MKHPRGSDRHKGHPAVWATLTIAAFPIVALATGWFGFGPFRSFAFGAGATLCIILVEGAVRGRWWFADPAIAKFLADPAFGQRMLVVLGLLVLLFQTLVLTTFLSQPTMDTNIVRFVLNRQCAAPQSMFLAQVCANRSTSGGQDAVTLAIREAAERRFFPSGFVTCAVRTMARENTTTQVAVLSYVHCDRWAISRIAKQPVAVESEDRPVISLVSVQPDGSFRVDAWADDPTSQMWVDLGNPPAPAQDACNQLLPGMQAETFRRAMERMMAR